MNKVTIKKVRDVTKVTSFHRSRMRSNHGNVINFLYNGNVIIGVTDCNTHRMLQKCRDLWLRSVDTRVYHPVVRLVGQRPNPSTSERIQPVINA